MFTMKEIINCHNHTFTIEHVPNKFLPFRLVQILKHNGIRNSLSNLIRKLTPFNDRDLFDRYMNFLEITANADQKRTFQRLRGYYPKNTKFVILSMDMEFMAAGKVKTPLEQQLTELNNLYKKYPENIFPFVAVDPRRKGVSDLVQKYIQQNNFRGIKMYPRLGFYPSDPELYPVFEFAQENNIPIMTHCSRGGVYTRKVTQKMLNHPVRGKVLKAKPKDFSHYFTEPCNYRKILQDFPRLKICLAHFGGNSEWDKYLSKEWDWGNENSQEKSWVSEIIEMMEEFPNLYTDVSYTVFHSKKYHAFLSIILENEKIKDRIMFGSDYYMVEQEKLSEREVTMELRHSLGEEKFWMLANTNVKTYLGIN